MNSVYLLDIGVTSQSKPAGIEIGKWYDIKIEINGSSVKGYLDGKLVQEVGDERSGAKSLCASASYDEKSGEIIVKVVNADSKSLKTQIKLNTNKKIAKNGKAIVLSSESPLDENTLEQPEKVIPKNENITISGNTFTQTFKGNSVSIIRFPVLSR